jgi:hypothetical protein
VIKLWFKVVPATIAAAIATGFLQQALQANAEYSAFVVAAARAGWVILIGAIVIFVADLGAMVVYAIRHGHADVESGTVVTGGPMASLDPRLMGRSKRKILGSRSGFASMESLVSGTATFGERMLVLGICIALASFFLIFLGAGLMLMPKLVILALLPTVPGFLLCEGARSAWKDYREAKAKLMASRAQHAPPAGTL